MAYLVLDHLFIYQTSLANLFSLISISNVYFANITNYFEQNSLQILNINLWSLSVQKQFYIVMPFFSIGNQKGLVLREKIFFIFLFYYQLCFSYRIYFLIFHLLTPSFLILKIISFLVHLQNYAQFLLGVVAMNLNQHKVISNLKINKWFLLIIISIFLFINFSFFQNFQYGSVLVISFLTLVYLALK